MGAAIFVVFLTIEHVVLKMADRNQKFEQQRNVCFTVEYLNDLFTLKRNLSNGRARGTRGPLREHPSSIHLNPLPPTCHPPPFFFPTNFGKVNGKNVKIIGSVSNTFVIQSVDLGTWLVWSIDFFLFSQSNNNDLGTTCEIRGNQKFRLSIVHPPSFTPFRKI